MKKVSILFLAALLTACNFHEVDPGKFYRSAQLSPKEMEAAIEAYKIKTVINLRGPNPGKEWYDEQKKVTDRFGVRQIDISMGSARLPHRRDLLALLAAMRDMPLPMLIHCQGGSDRTGEAAALYQMIYMQKPMEEAIEMLHPKYLHFSHLKPAKRYFIRHVWKGEDWAFRHYDPCIQSYNYYDKNSSECQNDGLSTPLTDKEDT